MTFANMVWRGLRVPGLALCAGVLAQGGQFDQKTLEIRNFLLDDAVFQVVDYFSDAAGHGIDFGLSSDWEDQDQGYGATTMLNHNWRFPIRLSDTLRLRLVRDRPGRGSGYLKFRIRQRGSSTTYFKGRLVAGWTRFHFQADDEDSKALLGGDTGDRIVLGTAWSEKEIQDWQAAARRKRSRKARTAGTSAGEAAGAELPLDSKAGGPAAAPVPAPPRPSIQLPVPVETKASVPSGPELPQAPRAEAPEAILPTQEPRTAPIEPAVPPASIGTVPPLPQAPARPEAPVPEELPAEPPPDLEGDDSQASIGTQGPGPYEVDFNGLDVGAEDYSLSSCIRGFL